MKEIPHGFRKVMIGEIIKEGDRYLEADGSFTNCCDSIGRVYPSHNLGKNDLVITPNISYEDGLKKESDRKFLSNIIIDAQSQAEYVQIIALLKDVYSFPLTWKVEEHDFNNDYKYVYIICKEISASKFPAKGTLHLTLKEVLEKLSFKIDKEVGEEKTNQIINFLKENRAFNEDSALEMPKEHFACICIHSKGLIKEYNGRFFVN